MSENDRPASTGIPGHRLGASEETPPSSEICRPAELARLLGLSMRSVYEHIRRKEVPGVRILGRSVLIHRPTVIKWIADGQGGGPRSRRSKS